MVKNPSPTTGDSSRITMMAPHILSSIALCFIMGVIQAKPPTEPPLIHGHPFIAIWNAPITQCRKHEIPVDLAAFQAVTTPSPVPDQFLIIFYENRLGLYPKIDTETGKSYDGGIPQKGNLKAHLHKARSQIPHNLTEDSPGLAVIDWESWRPLWARNWGTKKIYQSKSIEHAQKMNASLSPQEISKLAKQQFEEAGRNFMEKTISLGTTERPGRNWGFYLFPDCYNYGWEEPGYTGRCSEKTKEQNNELLWLWESSTGFFPSVYISESLRNSPYAKLYVRNRVQEALRVAELPKHPHTAPVYVYSRPLFRDHTEIYLGQMDLVSTVGEIAALGASGVVMWGSSSDYNTKAACESLSRYLKSTLNPYIANVTAAAMLCSEVLCQGKGRCIRKNYDATHYLHLNPANFIIRQTDGRYVANGLPSRSDVDALAENFTCQCYVGQTCSSKRFYPHEEKVFQV